MQRGSWQRRARHIIAGVAVVFAVAVALTLRHRTVPQEATPIARADPKATVQSEGGYTFRLNRDREEVRIEWKQLLSYPDGSSRMKGVRVTTERAGGRTFVITSDEGQIQNHEEDVMLAGNVKVVASDGMEVTADRATYTGTDGFVRSPGTVKFARGRTTGSGVGFTYDKNQNILRIDNEAVVRTSAAEGDPGLTIDAGGLEFRRNERLIRFERTMKSTRGAQTMAADSAVAHLSADEQRLEAMELRGNSTISGAPGAVGGLQALNGRDVDLKYGPDGQSIEHAIINGDSRVQLAGEIGQASRQIDANLLDITFAAEGGTPTLLVARDRVRLTLPADAAAPARTIESQALDAKGVPGRGLTSARFSGAVQFVERGKDLARTGRSNVLDAALAPGLSSIEEASFSQNVRFADGDMTATAPAARYLLGKGTLDLEGSAASGIPRVVNTRMVIDALRINMTLDGPLVKATGSVKSVLKPEKDGGKGEAHIPAMLKQDEPVNVTAPDLSYDGKAERAIYTGGAQLWQGETTIKGSSITIDSKSGNLAATGPVTTTALMLQRSRDGKEERVRSIGSSKDFAYDDSARRATYTGDAHLSGTQGDVTAPRIELYLRESGEEVDRAEAYDGITLRDPKYKTTGNRLTYKSEDESYIVNGAPVTSVDSCGRETVGRTLTFFRNADRIIVDGAERNRTQTTGKSNCP